MGQSLRFCASRRVSAPIFATQPRGASSISRLANARCVSPTSRTLCPLAIVSLPAHAARPSVPICLGRLQRVDLVVGLEGGPAMLVLHPMMFGAERHREAVGDLRPHALVAGIIDVCSLDPPVTAAAID